MSDNPESLFGGTQQMLELVESIYAAADEPELWPHVLDRISAAIHGESIAMFARFPDSELLAKARMPEDAWNEFAAYYATVNPIAPRCDQLFGNFQARFSHLAVLDSELEQTEFYQDFFRRHDMHYVAGITFPVVPGMPPVDISCQRPKHDGIFQPRDGELLRVLQPHLRRALTLTSRLQQLQASARGLEAAATSLDQVVFGVDGRGRVVFQSRGAEALLQTGLTIAVKDGILTAVNPAIAEQLAAQVAAAASLRQGRGAAGFIRIDRGEGVPPLHVSVFSSRSADVLGFPRTSALVLLSDPAAAPLSRAQALRSLYRLTPVELRVCDLLLAGKDTREVAEEMRLSLETVRFHVKRVLQKTGASRQSDLIRRMSLLPGAVAAD